MPQPFATWSDVLSRARTGAPLFYRAPLDRSAVRLTPDGVYRYRVGACTLRVFPPRSVADPFTADAGHLDRFSR